MFCSTLQTFHKQSCCAEGYQLAKKLVHLLPHVYARSVGYVQCDQLQPVLVLCFQLLKDRGVLGWPSACYDGCMFWQEYLKKRKSSVRHKQKGTIVTAAYRPAEKWIPAAQTRLLCLEMPRWRPKLLLESCFDYACTGRELDILLPHTFAMTLFTEILYALLVCNWHTTLQALAMSHSSQAMANQM